MNRYQFVGNIGSDAVVKTMESGHTVINFNVAITKKWKDKNGEAMEQTTWVNCARWVQPGTNSGLAQYLTKGKKVLVEGEPYANFYTDKDGKGQASLQVRVDNIELLSSAPTQQAPAGTHTPAAPYGNPAAQQQQNLNNQFRQATTPAANSFGADDDLPF